jgi:hypothetical protein
MESYVKFLAMLSIEFDRYIIENENLTAKIPDNALIIFKVDGEDDFNKWHSEISLKNKEPNQPVIYANINKWRKQSSIEKLQLAAA